MRNCLMIGAAALCACSRAPDKPAVVADLCKPPFQEPAVTTATAPKMGLQTDPTFLRLYNADQAADYCLRNAAYLARKVAGPIDQTAAAITAQCADLIGMYQASKHGPKWSAEQIADDDEEDNKERAPKALAMVLDYRTCASGVASPNVDSFAKPAEQP